MCRKVCSLCECPLALTSANFSASQSTLAVEEFADLHPRYKYYHSGIEVFGSIQLVAISVLDRQRFDVDPDLGPTPIPSHVNN